MGSEENGSNKHFNSNQEENTDGREFASVTSRKKYKVTKCRACTGRALHHLCHNCIKFHQSNTGKGLETQYGRYDCPNCKLDKTSKPWCPSCRMRSIIKILDEVGGIDNASSQLTISQANASNSSYMPKPTRYNAEPVDFGSNLSIQAEQQPSGVAMSSHAHDAQPRTKCLVCPTLGKKKICDRCITWYEINKGQNLENLHPKATCPNCPMDVIAKRRCSSCRMRNIQNARRLDSQFTEDLIKRSSQQNKPVTHLLQDKSPFLPVKEKQQKPAAATTETSMNFDDGVDDNNDDNSARPIEGEVQQCDLDEYLPILELEPWQILTDSVLEYELDESYEGLDCEFDQVAAERPSMSQLGHDERSQRKRTRAETEKDMAEQGQSQGQSPPNRRAN